MFKMTHNILRNLVVKKSTRRYPFEVRETFDKVRGELVNDIDALHLLRHLRSQVPVPVHRGRPQGRRLELRPLRLRLLRGVRRHLPGQEPFPEDPVPPPRGQTHHDQHAGRAQEKGERQGSGKGEGSAGGGAGSRVASARGSPGTGRVIPSRDFLIGFHTIAPWPAPATGQFVFQGCWRSSGLRPTAICVKGCCKTSSGPSAQARGDLERAVPPEAG